MPARLDLIDLDLPALVGYRRFVCCWLGRQEGLTYAVDPGPAATAPRLIERLRELGVDRLDFILLTHIHLDHAGGTALLLQAFPQARVFCHKTGRKHLTAPEKLWEGSCRILGAVAEAYGRPPAVPAGALADAKELAGAGIVPIQTPGHAPHHVSFLHGETLFVGEAAGTFLDLGDHGRYLRPATPPRFVLEVALASLDRLLALRPEPRRLAFAHHGALDGQTAEVLGLARSQLLRWVAVVRELCSPGPDGAATDPRAVVEPAIERLQEQDRSFALRAFLPPDVGRREESFTRQTLQGIVGYVLSGDGR